MTQISPETRQELWLVDRTICMIILALQLFSVVMCKNLMVKIYPVLTWKFFNWAFSPFVQCSMFSAGSMFHRLNKPNFRLFMVLYAVRRFLSNYLPTGSGKSLIFQMALIHMKMNENIHVSAIHQSTFSTLCMTTWRNYLFFGFKATFGGPKQDQ